MDAPDARRERVIASNARFRMVFAFLAVVVPLGLHLLFDRQEIRLRGLADHGRPAVGPSSVAGASPVTEMSCSISE